MMQNFGSNDIFEDLKIYNILKQDHRSSMRFRTFQFRFS